MPGPNVPSRILKCSGMIAIVQTAVGPVNRASVLARLTGAITRLSNAV